MQINCTNCSVTFELDAKLIPENGRLLQCGKCGHKWFYKKKIDDLNLTNNNYKKKNEEILSNEEVESKSLNNETIKKKEVKKLNIFKIFLVFIISFIAFIIIIDTFKNEIEQFYPEIQNLLNNLYQSLYDVTLFFKDLVK